MYKYLLKFNIKENAVKKIFAITFMLTALWGISAAYAGTNAGSTAKSEPAISTTVQPAITRSSSFTGHTQVAAEVRQTDIVVGTTATSLPGGRTFSTVAKVPSPNQSPGIFHGRTMLARHAILPGGHISYALNPTQPGAPPLAVITV